MIRSKLLLLIILAGLCLSACGDNSPTQATISNSQTSPTTKAFTATPAVSTTSPGQASTPSVALITTAGSVNTAAATVAGDPVPDTYEFIGETSDSGSNWTILENFADSKNKQFSSNNQKLECIAAKSCFNTNGVKDTNQAAYFEMVREGSKNWKYFRTFNTTDISCISTTECWKLNVNSLNEGVFATKDGGATWNSLTSGKSLTVAEANKPAYLRMRRSSELNSELEFTHTISCVNANRCLMVGEGRSIRTLDGGKTWDWFATEPLFNKDTICLNETTCYSVSSAAISYTNNFGESWQKFALPVKVSNLKSMSCASINFCVAGGDEGFFLTTRDKGASWVKRSILEKETLADVSCPDEVTCIAVILEGTLLETKDGGKTWEGKPIVLENFKGNARISCPAVTNCLMYYTKTVY